MRSRVSARIPQAVGKHFISYFKSNLLLFFFFFILNVVLVPIVIIRLLHGSVWLGGAGALSLSVKQRRKSLNDICK